MEIKTCEDCGEATVRRTRCKRCNLLVCRWCFNHVHALPMANFDPPACTRFKGGELES